MKWALGPTATNRHLISSTRALPLKYKTMCEKHDLMQSGKSSMTSWRKIDLL